MGFWVIKNNYGKILCSIIVVAYLCSMPDKDRLYFGIPPIGNPPTVVNFHLTFDEVFTITLSIAVFLVF